MSEEEPWGFIFGLKIDPYVLFNSQEFKERQELECQDSNPVVCKVFSRSPTGYVEMNWCYDCVKKNAEQIARDPYLEQCNVKSDKKTVDELYDLFSKYTKFEINKTPPSVFSGR